MRIIIIVAVVLIAVVENIKSDWTKIDGLDQARKAVERALPNLASCAELVIKKFESEKISIKNLEKVDFAFALLCDSFEILKKCSKTFADELHVSLRLDQHGLLDIAYNIAGSVLQFGCENRQITKEFITSPDLEKCSASKIQDLVNCTKTILGHEAQHFLKEPWEVLFGLRLTFNSQECSMLQEMEQCTVKVLENCENKTFSETLNSLYKYINNDIPCKDMPKSPRSAASPGSVVNFLLLFYGVIAISL